MRKADHHYFRFSFSVLFEATCHFSLCSLLDICVNAFKLRTLMEHLHYPYTIGIRLFVLIALSVITVNAQEIEPIDTNSVPISNISTDAPPAIIVKPIAKPAPPISTLPETELQKLYLSARDAQSSVPSGPERLKLRRQSVEEDSDLWESSLELGLTVNRGNTDSDAYLLRIETKRKGQNTEFLANAQGLRGESDGEITKDNTQGIIRYSQNLSEFDYHVFELRAFRDRLADIDYQFIATWSYGYYLIQNEDTFLSIEAGPGYVQVKKEDETSGYFAAHLAERGEASVNDSVIIWQAVDYFPSLDESSRYLVTAEAGIESVLGKNLSFRAALQNRYDSTPATDKEKNDISTLLSLVKKL